MAVKPLAPALRNPFRETSYNASVRDPVSTERPADPATRQAAFRKIMATLPRMSASDDQSIRDAGARWRWNLTQHQVDTFTRFDAPFLNRLIGEGVVDQGGKLIPKELRAGAREERARVRAEAERELLERGITPREPGQDDEEPSST